MPTFEAMKAGYRTLWNTLVVSPSRKAAVDAVATRINNNRERYSQVAAKFPGMPWYIIGMWHYREDNNDFRGVLHNGEHIIGTGRKTTLVPAGRGPFSTWEEAAIDALRIKNLQNIRDWPIERIGYESERFNGFGYLKFNINSPYLWSGSNLYSMGKYVADGRYDANHVDKQLGVMTIMRRIFDLGYAVEPQKQAAPLPPEPVGEAPDKGGSADETKEPIQTKSILTKIAEFVTAGGTAVIGMFTGMPWQVGVALIVVLGIGTFMVIRYRLQHDDVKNDNLFSKVFGV